MQTSIRKIVIPVDFTPSSERAARYGCALAKSLGAHVYLIHVIEEAKSDHPLREARAQLILLVDRLDAFDRMTTEVRLGPAAEAITSAVTAYGADLVVMGTHGRTGLSHLVHGSVAEEVIRTGSCPVLVLRDSGSANLHPAMAAA